VRVCEQTPRSALSLVGGPRPRKNNSSHVLQKKGEHLGLKDEFPLLRDCRDARTHARTLLVTMSTPESRPDLVQRVTSESSAVPSEAPDSASETDSLASVPLALASVPELQQALQSALLQLEREKSARARLQVQLDRQTQLQGQLQVQAEQEEEYITNKLMKRLEALQQEKEELARQGEVEEEMITTNITAKLLEHLYSIKKIYLNRAFLPLSDSFMKLILALHPLSHLRRKKKSPKMTRTSMCASP
jgi:hypothetical protein